jgi:hypothetical protein
VTKPFFQSFGISMAPGVSPTFQQYFVDFKTGKPVTLPPSDPVVTGAALQKYTELCQKYFSFLFPNYNLPNPLGADQSDLASTFGQFVQKYNLYPIVPIVAQFVFSKNLLETPTIFVLANFGLLQLQAIAPGSTTPFLVPTSFNNSELYGKIQAHLAPQLLLSSSVVKVDRSGPGANDLWVQTPSGCKHVKAKKILVTMGPITENMAVFDLDNKEKSVFKNFDWQALYAGLVANTGLPASSMVINTSPNPAKVFLPDEPFVRAFSGFVPGTQHTSVLGAKGLSTDGAKDLVVKSLKNMKTAGTFQTNDPIFLGFASHTPSVFVPSPKQIQCGFWAKANSLQGHKDTYYIGAAWSADYTPVIWTHAAILLQKMMA